MSLSFHPFHQELFCCGSHSQTLLEGLSQVTVGVLFPINSLQIFFLDQNVNAFLGIIFLKRKGSEREEKQIYYQERQTVGWILPYLAAQWGGSKVTSYTSYTPRRAVFLPRLPMFCRPAGSPSEPAPTAGSGMAEATGHTPRPFPL